MSNKPTRRAKELNVPSPARKGDMLLVEVVHSNTMLHGATTQYREYVLCQVHSSSRTGVAQSCTKYGSTPGSFRLCEDMTRWVLPKCHPTECDEILRLYYEEGCPPHTLDDAKERIRRLLKQNRKSDDA